MAPGSGSTVPLINLLLDPGVFQLGGLNCHRDLGGSRVELLRGAVSAVRPADCWEGAASSSPFDVPVSGSRHLPLTLILPALGRMPGLNFHYHPALMELDLRGGDPRHSRDTPQAWTFMGTPSLTSLLHPGHRTQKPLGSMKEE